MFEYSLASYANAIGRHLLNLLYKKFAISLILTMDSCVVIDIYDHRAGLMLCCFYPVNINNWLVEGKGEH